MIVEGMIPRIERAFGFSLYDWQKDYLLGKAKPIMGGKANGKTFAYVVRLLLSDGEPINHRELFEYRDGDHGSGYRIWFVNYVLEINEKLVKAGYKTRVVK